jgi:ankyrin repeat protein
MYTFKIKPLEVTKALSTMSSNSTKHQIKTKKIVKAAKEKTPTTMLKSIVGASDISSIEFRKASEKDISSYDVEVVRVIRSKDLMRLKEMYANGRSMNACNQFGESLVHMVCRRGDVQILKFMIEEARVSFKIKDDFGRNPFHDACWTPTPNFEMMDMLIANADTSLLLAEDVRGNSPFDYTRREHHSKWLAYLENKKEAILKGLDRAKSQESSI